MKLNRVIRAGPQAVLEDIKKQINKILLKEDKK